MKRIQFLIAGMLCLLGSLQAQKITEKADLTYSLMRYFEWQGTGESNSLKIAIYGSFELYKAVANRIVGESLDGYYIEAMNIARESDLTLTNYHILYVSKEHCSPVELKRITEMVEGTNTIVIGESDRSIANGADISMFLVNGELQAEYSFHKCVSKELKISSKVDAFAMRVN